jgi:hypothetical protein
MTKMIKQPCIIILDQPTEYDRQAVHEIVKTNSTDWWHHFSDIWIAGGLQEKEWRLLIMEEFSGQVLVIALPADRAGRTWSGSFQELANSSDSLGGPFAWLAHVYSGRDIGEVARRESVASGRRKAIPAVPVDDSGYSDEPPF